MPNWTAPPTYTAGQVLADTDFNLALRDNPSALAQRPIIQGWVFGAYPGINASTWTTVPFNAVNFSPVSMQLNSSTGEITLTGGANCMLWFSATLFWASNATGVRGIRIFDNYTNAELAGNMIDAVSVTYTEQSWCGLLNVTNNSRIVVQAYQSSTASPNLTLTGGQTGRTQFSAYAVYWN